MFSSFSAYLSKFSQVCRSAQSVQTPLLRHPLTWILVPMAVVSIFPPLKDLQSSPAAPTGSALSRATPRPAAAPLAQPSGQPAPAQPAAPQDTVQPKPQQSAPQAQAIQKAPVPQSLPIGGTLPTGASRITLRVAIAEGQTSLVLGSSTAAQIVDEQGLVLATLNPNEGTSAQVNADTLQVGDRAVPTAVWLLPSEDGAVYVGDRWYRGAVQLSLQERTLLAVNYVDLEEYLYSVVSAEVSPSWPLAAQKAQAIAARSFALVHYFRPASALYDIGSTERYQVYSGLGNEWNTSQQAVEETRGLVLSYEGGVVESQYAASEELVKEVFGGRGMSQQGAYQLSAQGYSFQQILGYFYPGTSLARLQAS